MHRQLNSYRCVMLLLVALLFAVSAHAQLRYTYRDSLGTYRVIFRPAVQSDDYAVRYNLPLAENTNELRIGFGHGAYITNEWTFDHYWDYEYNQSLESDRFNVYPARWVTLGVEMGNWIKEWFYVGGTVVYTGGFKRVLSVPLRRHERTLSFNNFAIMPQLRFAWVRRNIVQLYSGIGMGVQFAFWDNDNIKEVGYDIAFDVTYIGISVGRKFFGYLDFGPSSRGILSFGFGYRFNNK